MIETAVLSSLLTSLVFLSAVLLPIFFVYRILLYILRNKQLHASLLLEPIDTVLPSTTQRALSPKPPLQQTLPVVENTPTIPLLPVEENILEVAAPTSSPTQEKLELVSAVKYAPKDTRKASCENRPNAGEDAFFTYSNPSDENQDGRRLIGAMGIADGVGGYADLGVDAGLMAWQTMDNALSYFADAAADMFSSPRDVLHHSYEDIKTKKQVECGGTTVCLLSIFTDETNEAKLQYCNLGDSGFLVVRNGEVVFRTQDQTHYFNAPYQLAIPPKHRTVIMNQPHEADQLPYDELLRVQEGDYIILATDGIWDNMFDEEIVEILKANEEKFAKEPNMITEATAAEILQKTSNVALNLPHPVMTPFQKYAMDNNKNWVGGKIDDITVAVARISLKA